MMRHRWVLLGLALAGLSFAACADGGAATSGEKAGSDEIVATANGESITRAELEKRIAGQVQQLRQQEYELRANAIKGMILERMVEKRAEAEGLTRDQYLEREVRARATEPTPEEIQAIYEQYKDQPGLKGKSLEEATPLIVPQLQQQKLQEAQSVFVDDMLKEANVRLEIEPPRYDLTIPAGEPSMGSKDAPVTLVEFSDFQCGYCKRAHPTVKQILDEYGDKVRFVYRDYGIPNHTRARAAAEAARCAGDQDKYWAYFDNLMETPGSLDDADLTARAGTVGLDTEAFQACLDSDKHVDAVNDSFEAAGDLGINGTPTFFVNGRMLVGAQPIEEFREIIDDELARASKS